MIKRGMSLLLSCAAAVALTAGVSGAANAGAGDCCDQIDDLQRQINLLQSQMDELKANNKSESDGWWTKTKISGRMYYNISHIEHKRDSAHQSDEGTGFDIKRFYVGIDHKFDDTFSVDVTTDFTYDSTTGATQVYVKKAYVDINLDKALDIRLGSSDLPWVPFVEGLYGYRYVENVLIDRTKFGTSADWGVHLKGDLADGHVSYALSAFDGAGYKHPFRSKGVDVEGRVSVNVSDFTVAVGGYYGKLGKDVQGSGTPVQHKAKRLNALAAYTGHNARIGVEYFHAEDWNNVLTVASDSSDGFGAFASYQFDPKWGVFGRYDHVKPNKDTVSNLKENYFNVGVAYSPIEIVDFALVYKRDKADNGFLSTSNGTIGSLTQGSGDGTYDEVGVWGRVRW